MSISVYESTECLLIEDYKDRFLIYRTDLVYR